LRGVPRAFGFTFVLLGLLLASLRVAAAFPIACLGRGTGFPGSLWAFVLRYCCPHAPGVRNARVTTTSKTHQRSKPAPAPRLKPRTRATRRENNTSARACERARGTPLECDAPKCRAPKKSPRNDAPRESAKVCKCKLQHNTSSSSRLNGGAKARLLYRYVGDNEKTYKDNLDNQHFSCPRAKNQRRTLHRNSRFPSGVTG
jgi:hypothetical protein